MPTLEAEAVDIAQLDRYTGGDRALNEDVLRLFDGQCNELSAALDDAAAAADARLWHQITHSLKGAARGIGAHALAATAAEAETVDVADDTARTLAISRLRGRMMDVRAFIARFLG